MGPFKVRDQSTIWLPEIPYGSFHALFMQISGNATSLILEETYIPVVPEKSHGQIYYHMSQFRPYNSARYFKVL